MNKVETIDAVEYDNYTKDHWRRTCWNIVEKHAPNKHDALILYLPGTRDIDRSVALKKKYKDHCLVAIERNPKVVDILRKKGVIVVPGDLVTVMQSWPVEYPVSFVLADLQTNNPRVVADILMAFIIGGAFRKAGIIYNLQRGRETSETMRMYAQFKEMFPGKSVNRAMAAWMNVMLMFGFIFKMGTENSIDSYYDSINYGGPLQTEFSLDPAIFKLVYEALNRTIRYSLLQPYRSDGARVVMDSASLITRKGMSNSLPSLDRVAASPDMVRSIAAALAVRTIRMKEFIKR